MDKGNQHVHADYKKKYKGSLTLLLYFYQTVARKPTSLRWWVVHADKTELLLRATKNDELREEYRSLFRSYDKHSIEIALAEKSNDLTIKYHKVWNSYQCCKNKLQTDNRTKELMRQNVIVHQLRKSITDYRIYTDLNLNMGNTNAWLKTGDPNNVSLETARLILQYVKDFKE